MSIKKELFEKEAKSMEECSECSDVLNPDWTTTQFKWSMKLMNRFGKMVKKNTHFFRPFCVKMSKLERFW